MVWVWSVRVRGSRKVRTGERTTGPASRSLLPPARDRRLTVRGPYIVSVVYQSICELGDLHPLRSCLVGCLAACLEYLYSGG